MPFRYLIELVTENAQPSRMLFYDERYYAPDARLAHPSAEI